MSKYQQDITWFIVKSKLYTLMLQFLTKAYLGDTVSFYILLCYSSERRIRFSGFFLSVYFSVLLLSFLHLVFFAHPGLHFLFFFFTKKTPNPNPNPMCRTFSLSAGIDVNHEFNCWHRDPSGG